MPVRVRCQGCEALYELPERLFGKTVRCKACSQTFKVPGGSESDSDGPASGLKAKTSPHVHIAAVKDMPKKTKPGAMGGDEPSGSKTTGKDRKKSSGERRRTPMALLIGLAALIGIAGAAAVWFFVFNEPEKTARPAVKPKQYAQIPDDDKDTGKGKTPPEEIIGNPTPVKGKTDDGKAKSNEDKPKENDEPLATEETVSYVTHVKPVLTKYCGKCHGDKKSGGANLMNFESIMVGGRSQKKGRTMVVPGEPDKSLIVLAIEQKGPTMPPKKEKQPAAREKEVVRIWVKAGAKDDTAEKGGTASGVQPANEEADEAASCPCLEPQPFEKIAATSRIVNIPDHGAVSAGTPIAGIVPERLKEQYHDEEGPIEEINSRD